MKRIARTKAKTAWDLLNEIAALILEEPKRYDQGNWVQLVEGKEEYEAANFPVCGTVGCVAGWTAVLTQGRMKALKLAETFRDYQIGIHLKAQTVLGLSEQQAKKLFDGDALNNLWYQLTQLHVSGNRLKPGTTEYALLGAMHIYGFMHENEKQLRRTRIKSGK